MYQQPYYMTKKPNGLPATLKGGTRTCAKSQTGGGSDYQGLFHAVAMDPRQLSVITARYIDRSPMFNPLRFDTVIPTIYDGIVPTGAYLLAQMPTTPAYDKYAVLAGGCPSAKKPKADPDMCCLGRSRV